MQTKHEAYCTIRVFYIKTAGHLQAFWARMQCTSYRTLASPQKFECSDRNCMVNAKLKSKFVAERPLKAKEGAA